MHSIVVPHCTWHVDIVRIRIDDLTYRIRSRALEINLL